MNTISGSGFLFCYFITTINTCFSIKPTLVQGQTFGNDWGTSNVTEITHVPIQKHFPWELRYTESSN